MGLGRKGDRVAKTPMRMLPPSRGGRTVGDQVSRTALEKDQISHRWENPSSPRRASGFRYSGSKTMAERSSGTSPLCRGMPNLLGKALCMVAMIFMGTGSVMETPSWEKFLIFSSIPAEKDRRKSKLPRRDKNLVPEENHAIIMSVE